ncbi:zf-HC2 domain-containing protein [Streptomyces montanisoli]|uniref:Zf-HC2 domain-containing protein n=1 Tax=Streptomyces montanisoli TaxID=2798581 RepID=A0A940MEL3_9ACTN|nr:zf-HC2 domain-containing protein [Streptomyces montanisoli]MBP0458585.1 zf-HC2 domain-containing protein [Streptomyces montanisoli]
MTAHGGRGAHADGRDDGSAHEAVGAYALGILDAEGAAAFEEHLAGCVLCAERLEELAGMEPVLALLADEPDGPDGPAGRDARDGRDARHGRGARDGRDARDRRDARDGRDARDRRDARDGRDGRDGRDAPDGPAGGSASAGQGPYLLDRLVDEVAARRARRRRRGYYLTAAAVVLIAGGPAAALLATSSDGAPATAGRGRSHTDDTDLKAVFESMETKHAATDPATDVSATVALRPEPWGTSAMVELKNVKGPLSCHLVAVSRSGDRQVVSSWAVPAGGYGAPSGPGGARQPLYVLGGAALRPGDIDHFDVTTLDGKRLVRVPD